MSDQISASVADGLGHVTLDRPQALNALSYEMIRELTDVFELWRDDSEVGVVVLDGAGERGFSAGGDIRELYEYATNGNAGEAREFFRAEYRLDAMIARYPKPVVAIMDGITMGGGIGLAGHAAIRVVTERSRVAMPETRIGFTPDVGGSWLLARAPGELGVHLALNSRTMDAADALHAGFADSFVPSERLPHLLQALAERADPGSPAEIVMLFDETPGPSALALARDWVDACYSAPTVAEIITRLRAFAEGRSGCRIQFVPAASARPRGIRVRGGRGRGARDALADGAHRHARVGAARSHAAQPRGGARAGVPTRVLVHRAARPARGHPRAGDRQGPIAEVEPRHARRGRPRTRIARDRRAGARPGVARFRRPRAGALSRLACRSPQPAARYGTLRRARQSPGRIARFGASAGCIR